MSTPRTPSAKAILGDVVQVGLAPMVLLANAEYTSSTSNPWIIGTGLATLGATALMAAFRFNKVLEEVSTHEPCPVTGTAQWIASRRKTPIPSPRVAPSL